MKYYFVWFDNETNENTRPAFHQSLALWPRPSCRRRLRNRQSDRRNRWPTTSLSSLLRQNSADLRPVCITAVRCVACRAIISDS